MFSLQSLAASGYRIFGTVIDSDSGECLAGAAVVLYDGNAKQIRGRSADAGGRFEFTDVACGDFVLRISYIGYEPQSIALAISDCDVDAGEIGLLPAAAAVDEVIVTADAEVRRIDRQLVMPTAAQRRASSSGISLLQHLQISGLSVNPIDRSVTTLSGDAVQLRINGIEADREQIVALRPADVVRIEYHDNPGLRYGNAAAVVDYIVRRRERGGNVAADLTNGIRPAGYGEYNLSARYDGGKSSVGAVAYWERRDLQWNRENYETFRLSDRVVANEEIGLPTRFRYDNVNVALNYTYADGDSHLLNVVLRNRRSDTPNSFSDRNSTLFREGEEYAVADNLRSNSNIPSLDIYYQLNMKDGGRLYLDMVGTYLDSRSYRSFMMSRPEGSPIDILSRTEGEKYSLIGEAIYERPLWGGRFTAGVKHTLSHMNNVYDGDIESEVKMTSAESYMFVEYGGNIGRLDYTIGVGVMRTEYEQEQSGQERYIARPTLTLSYRAADNIFLRYNAYLSGYAPSLSALSDVCQQIDPYQVRRGNPDLKSVVFFANTLSAAWRSRFASIELSGRYSYDDKPIMEQTLSDGGRIVRTYANQRGFHRLNVNADIRLTPCGEYVMIRLAPFFNRYVSLGNDYTHTHSNWGIRAGVMAMYKNWSFMFEMNTSCHEFWGETLTEGESIHSFAVGYNREKWSIQAMVMNPFTRDYRQTAVNFSQAAPYRQTAFSRDFSPMFLLNCSFNLDFGKQRRNAGRRIDNSDTDTGILSGNK
ncbi:MAG: outer membrane beta-barrel protein [Alistipes sp.]|nr:outer membrane beta-barrel protein [Alistipes sp.]